MRRVASSNEFFDILDNIGNGKFVTIGYVTGANLNVPTVKRKNPLTNRMKGYPDYSVFNSEEEIGALVSVSSYNFQYLNRQTVNKKYGEYKQSANDIRANFGLDPIGTKQSYKQGTDWSPNGPELYKGNNAELNDHSYNPQNMHGVKPKSVVYAVNKDGHIINALSQEQIQPYLSKKREIDGVAALRKMEVEEDRIQDYINQIQNLKFKYKNFESNSILWIAATINGEKIVYINDSLNRAVDGINIRPEDFRAIARERYQIDLANLQEMANRLLNKSKINEGDTILGNFHKGQLHKAAKGQKNHDWYDRHPEDLDRNMNVYDTGCKGTTSLMAQGMGGKEKEKIAKSYRSTINQTKKAANESMNKSIFRLTESELKNMIKESAMKIISELDWRTYASAAKKNDIWRKENPHHKAHQWNRSYDFQNAAHDAFNKKYGLEGQYDERYGGDKGSINLEPYDDFSISGSRDHDFGDPNPHGLNHNVYHMSKKYGKDGGYGRTRMWDFAHETTPEEFYGDEEMGKKFRDAEKEVEDFSSGKSHYVKGKGWTNESKNPKQVNERIFSPEEYEDHAFMQDYWADRERQIEDDWKQKNIEIRKRYPGHSKEWYDAMLDTYQIGENRENKNKVLTEDSFQNNQGYSHFAVNKSTNKIVNGWDYKDYDPSELRQFKSDYFIRDLIDYDLDPKQYKIVTGKFLIRQGIDPNDNNNWANN